MSNHFNLRKLRIVFQTPVTDNLRVAMEHVSDWKCRVDATLCDIYRPVENHRYHFNLIIVICNLIYVFWC